jgi:hypothetical protein
MKTTSDLKDIARAGGSIRLSAVSKTSSDLKDIARALTENASLIITDATSKTTSDLKDIARAGVGKVVFDFTD